MDEEDIKPSVEFVEKILKQSIFRSISISSIDNSVFAIGEEITMISAVLPDSIYIQRTDFSQRASIQICYCSIFGDCWVYTDGDVDKSSDCD